MKTPYATVLTLYQRNFHGLFTVAAQDFANVGKTANYQTHIFPSLACEKLACANQRKSDVFNP
jgi:hypothetical protein